VILWSLYYSSCGPICSNIYWTIKWTATIFSNIRSSASERIKQGVSFMYYGNLNIPVWLFTAYKDEFCCLQGQDVDYMSTWISITILFPLPFFFFFLFPSPTPIICLLHCHFTGASLINHISFFALVVFYKETYQTKYHKLSSKRYEFFKCKMVSFLWKLYSFYLIYNCKIYQIYCSYFWMPLSSRKSQASGKKICYSMLLIPQKRYFNYFSIPQ